MYLLFAVCAIILFLFSYYAFHKDLMEPAVLIIEILLFAIMLSFYLYGYWHLYEYSIVTALLFILGVSSFMIGALLAQHKLTIKVSGSDKSKILKPCRRIDINSIVYAVLLLTSLLTFVYFIVYFRRNSGMGSIAKVISEFKAYRTSEEANMPVILNMLIKLIGMSSYLCLYVFINNTICNKNIIKEIKLLIVPILFCVICIFNANRGDVLQLCMGTFAAWYIIFRRVHGWKTSMNTALVKRIMKTAFICLFGFWLMIFIMQDTENRSESNFMTYIAAYVSGPLASFDVYIKQGGSDPRWFGEETFVAMNNNLSQLFDLSYNSSRFLEFRQGNGYSVVNVYSSFRRFYHDFGVFGVFILSLLQGYVTSRLYRYVKRKKVQCAVDLGMCVYCYFFYTIPYTITDELFYSSNISLSGLLKLIMLLLVYKLFFLGSSINRPIRVIKMKNGDIHE